MGRKLNYVLSFRPINTGCSRRCVFRPGAGGEEAAGSLAEGETLDGQADPEVEEKRDAAEAVGVHRPRVDLAARLYTGAG
jgi:hypothetical protein